MKLYRKLYSGSDKDKIKLNRSDRLNLKYLKALPKPIRDSYRNLAEGDKKGTVLLGTALGASNGGLITGLCNEYRAKGKKLSTVKGALVGSLIGTGLGALSAKNSKRLDKLIPSRVRKRDRYLDRIKLANGEITEDEFIDKYYKNK